LHRLHRLAGALGAAAAALVLPAIAPAAAAAPPLADPHVAVHFDLAAGRTPENIALEPDGAADVTFVGARQVARVGTDGRIQVLATLPAPPANSTPLVGVPAPTGIARAHDGTLFVNYAAGTADLTGIWRLSPGHAPQRIAALPADGFPNGLALDEHSGQLYAADSVHGVVWRVPLHGGTATAWARGPELQPAGLFGANGVKVQHDAVWVSNTDRGTLLRIPVGGGDRGRDQDAAGPIETRATGLAGIDDFAFPGSDDTVLAALDGPGQVARITPDGRHTVVLDRQDGLCEPTAVAFGGTLVYVTSAASTTGTDPNLLLARLQR
jgi:sugar lactone lactonase YvrE